MNWADYLIPAKIGFANHAGFVVYNGEPTFNLPESTKIAFIGIPEDRFSEGAGEIKSPGFVRKQMYALSSGTLGTVVDMGNIRTGKTLTDTYYCIRDLVSELYRRNIVTLLIGGTMDLSFGNYLAMQGEQIVMTNISPLLRFREGEKHPLNKLTFTPPPITSHLSPTICNVGYQSYYVSQDELDYFSDRYYEAYRLGEIRSDDLRGSEPIIRDSDLVSISMNVVKHSDAPAASISSPSGFTGEEICQLAFFAGLSHKCRSLGIYDMLTQNDMQNITAKLAAQMAWYFIEGVKKRNTDHPKDNEQNFKKYIIYFDQLHHDLCFFKNIITERWWMEVPSITNIEKNLIISCTPEDYLRATEKEIPDRWWKTYQRIN